MKKIAKKRGRPATNSYIEGIIATRVRDDERELPDKRMPTKVLAGEIQREIKREIGQNGKLKGERLPKLSTLEKKISKYRSKYRKGVFDEDKPWSLASLREYPLIPPEALPTLLQLWIYMLDEEDLVMTIREAKWAARFYAAVNAGAKNVENPIYFLSLFARAYATSEMIAEMNKSTLDVGSAFDSTLWVLVTGKPITNELAEKIYRRIEPDVYIRTTDKEWARSQQINEQLGHKVHLELYGLYEKSPSKRKGGKK